jgi:hypothetical protein
MEVTRMARDPDAEVTESTLDERELSYIAEGADPIQNYLATVPDGETQLVTSIGRRLARGR